MAGSISSLSSSAPRRNLAAIGFGALLCAAAAFGFARPAPSQPSPAPSSAALAPSLAAPPAAPAQEKPGAPAGTKPGAPAAAKPGAIQYDTGLVAWYAVSDFDRSIRWYGEVLGLALTTRVDEMGWAEFETATKGARIGLSRVQPGEKIATDGGATVVLAVKDLDATRAALEKQGVAFDGATVVIDGYVKLAIFFDPDRNQLELSQSLARER